MKHHTAIEILSGKPGQ